MPISSPGTRCSSDLKDPTLQQYSAESVSTEQSLGTFEESKGSITENYVQDSSVDEHDDGNWQPMEVISLEPTHLINDIDDDNEIIEEKKETEKVEESELEPRYTRVFRDEDDDQKHQLDSEAIKLLDIADHGNEEISMDSQLEITGNILSETEKMAYAGVCRLLILKMVDKIACFTTLPWYRGECKAALEDTIMWADKTTSCIYEHLGVTVEEQKMIENLHKHSVQIDDLSKILVSAHRAQTVSSLDAVLVDEVESSDSLSSLGKEKPVQIDVRWTVLCDLFLVLISKSLYDCRSRSLLMAVGEVLDINEFDVAKFEKHIVETIQIDDTGELEAGSSANTEAVMKLRRKVSRRKKYILMGLAGIGGGLVIGLSSGLLAPIISAGIGAAFTTVGLSGVATSGFLAGGGSAALITAGGAISGAHIGTTGMAHRKADVKTFEFRPLHAQRRANVIVTVSGWMLSKEDDVRLSFATLDPIVGDIYSVFWEPEMLASAGQTMNILATEVVTQSLQQVLGSTVLVSLMGALQWPLILTKLGYLIDNPWNNSLDRAKATGQLLADMLCYRSLGVRPVTLVGYSLGARVIYYCLRELEKKKEFSIIENVYLFGTPVIFKRTSWLKAASVVSGRFVNGYKKNDWILGYLFRATSGGIGRVAGLRQIDCIPGIENIDVTNLVSGHLAYRESMPILLAAVGFEVLDEEVDLVSEPIPEPLRERQSQLLYEIEAEECQNKQKELIEKSLMQKGRSLSPKKSNAFFDSKKIREELKKVKKKYGSSFNSRWY
ncbi:Membrane protein [Schizosaccharomyces pombe]|uniref:Uncharacterized membrane protein C6F6.13c n=1 Tax=Schizosaccharomyces pombe (strain 972 / ATCC 24843) TaxID=284812 RepID=YELD_SCHPO|nr:uncharacterized protein SPAC6F6.13c [Schizosaccharomyces pombe]O14244.1 RecName: Full=Uncharacterized membrane protein C6F6.13c [Schizosaccharomyces pombe 972h-]CAB11736.1 DUF726 family protein [Schizosaccharomyces pombe]|eukprot:NP_593906.1 uncharacterized protein SPAC6F6.13c [Schizosaccharomyces pombe]